ncbi:serine O-acetyltransferase [Limosilactobacillus reuteri subsp. suis]|uniref:serine O-acetyltransferase n=1 Tax=Limosilactobacillus reuteri TaxID=1598 RepID=UPI0039931D40
MIDTKAKLRFFLKMDRIALGNDKRHIKILGDEIWKYQIILRKYEYLKNKRKNPLDYIRLMIIKLRYHKLSIKLGINIPPNVFGPGLSIAHYGTIVVNSNSRVGKNCRIQEGVNIGATNGKASAPQIGNNVFIGSGAKIIGKVTIADDVAIGAGCVVVKSITEKGITVAGVPAKKVSDHNSHSNLSRDLMRQELL